MVLRSHDQFKASDWVFAQKPLGDGGGNGGDGDGEGGGGGEGDFFLFFFWGGGRFMVFLDFLQSILDFIEPYFSSFFWTFFRF